MFPEAARAVEETAALGLVLDAPLQAWGTASRFQRRGTGTHPSKSALLGLLAAALGVDKHGPGEGARLAPLCVLRLTTCRVPRAASRVGAGGLVGRLADYHTIGGGYDTATEGGYLSTPRKAGGGPFGTVVTQREYLTDALFVAVLTGARETLDSVAAALRNPVWGGWLGRKCCLPATPVRALTGVTEQEVLNRCLEKLGLPPQPLGDFDRCREVRREEVVPGERSALDSATDEPVSFGGREHVSRLFIHRRAGQPD